MDVLDVFYLLGGRGRGSPRHQEGEGRFFAETPRRGGLPGVGGGGARGREGVCGEWGEAKYFFSGPIFPPRKSGVAPANQTKEKAKTKSS